MSLISQPLQAVVALFEGPLAGVRFADIDASGLSKLSADVASAAAEVEQQEAKLSELRQSLAQRQEALLGLAQQALAYARVYAENDDELLAKLNDISLPRATKPRKATPAKARGASEAEATAATHAEPSVEAAEEPAVVAVEDDVPAPAKTKPAYERPKIKRRLGRAAPQGDSV
jgi:hypothetical protein